MFNPKKSPVVIGIVCLAACFVVIILFDFISSEYSLCFVHNIIIEKKTLSYLAL